MVFDWFLWKWGVGVFCSLRCFVLDVLWFDLCWVCIYLLEWWLLLWFCFLFCWVFWRWWFCVFLDSVEVLFWFFVVICWFLRFWLFCCVDCGSRCSYFYWLRWDCLLGRICFVWIFCVVCVCNSCLWVMFCECRVCFWFLFWCGGWFEDWWLCVWCLVNGDFNFFFFWRSGGVIFFDVVYVECFGYFYG